MCFHLRVSVLRQPLIELHANIICRQICIRINAAAQEPIDCGLSLLSPFNSFAAGFVGCRSRGQRPIVDLVISESLLKNVPDFVNAKL